MARRATRQRIYPPAGNLPRCAGTSRDAPGRIRTCDPRIRSPRQRFRTESLEVARSLMVIGLEALKRLSDRMGAGVRFRAFRA
jgi:hypothetical protein